MFLILHLITFIPSFLLLTHTSSHFQSLQFLRWSSRLTFHQLPLGSWCTSPAWFRLETCPYASRGARMGRRSCPPLASLSTQRSSWAPSRYPRCRSNTMATTPALPAMMLPLSAQRGSLQSPVSVKRLVIDRSGDRDVIVFKDLQWFSMALQVWSELQQKSLILFIQLFVTRFF